MDYGMLLPFSVDRALQAACLELYGGLSTKYTEGWARYM